MSSDSSSTNKEDIAADVPNILAAEGVFDPFAAITEIRFSDGRMLQIPTSALAQAELAPPTPAHIHNHPEMNDPDALVVPIAEERLRVDRRTVETGKVNLRKVVQEYETQLNEILAVRTFDIERVLINKPVEDAPAIRHDGATTIYPVLEEQLIVTRQLILKEELHVTQWDSERRDIREVTLRRETIDVERS